MSGPTVADIARHIEDGGYVERRSTPSDPWLSSKDHPQIASRPWRSFPDQNERWETYRLVPFAPTP